MQEGQQYRTRGGACIWVGCVASTSEEEAEGMAVHSSFSSWAAWLCGWYRRLCAASLGLLSLGLAQPFHLAFFTCPVALSLSRPHLAGLTWRSSAAPGRAAPWGGCGSPARRTACRPGRSWTRSPACRRGCGSAGGVGKRDCVRAAGLHGGRPRSMGCMAGAGGRSGTRDGRNQQPAASGRMVATCTQHKDARHMMGHKDARLY